MAGRFSACLPEPLSWATHEGPRGKQHLYSCWSIGRFAPEQEENLSGPPGPAVRRVLATPCRHPAEPQRIPRRHCPAGESSATGSHLSVEIPLCRSGTMKGSAATDTLRYRQVDGTDAHPERTNRPLTRRLSGRAAAEEMD
jgi:hypothetical protein